jgi:hypothetical protein
MISKRPCRLSDKPFLPSQGRRARANHPAKGFLFGISIPYFLYILRPIGILFEFSSRSTMLWLDPRLMAAYFFPIVVQSMHFL